MVRFNKYLYLAATLLANQDGRIPISKQITARKGQMEMDNEEVENPSTPVGEGVATTPESVEQPAETVEAPAETV